MGVIKIWCLWKLPLYLTSHPLGPRSASITSVNRATGRITRRRCRSFMPGIAAFVTVSFATIHLRDLISCVPDPRPPPAQRKARSRGQFEICLRTPTKGSPVRISVMKLPVISIVVAVAVAFIVAFVTFVLTKLRNQAAETKEQNASKQLKGPFPCHHLFDHLCDRLCHHLCHLCHLCCLYLCQLCLWQSWHELLRQIPASGKLNQQNSKPSLKGSGLCRLWDGPRESDRHHSAPWHFFNRKVLSGKSVQLSFGFQL